MSAQNKIHIAYGFHVNLYHSYRGDTCDNLGFGSDIRIIRKIIKVLDELNESGIPVKGTWDTENFFSLEKILPVYAPDIIDGIRRRVQKYGDENIIMGYSNGALGAMTDEELAASLRLAVTNEGGSGLLDLFGEYEPIVRPQEVMFTPSQVSVYNKCGIKALCLYRSCIPFDSFATIIPPLTDGEAYNPLTYEYKGESLTVIPTYSNADACDAGCLRAWVKKLRKKQLSGEIQNDLFIFINMDADAIFWESLDIPLIGGKIANTDGIHGLVTEIADLDYIVFDTPGGYIKNHPPIGRISFTQDTADGNFTGFSSWAEKPYNRKIWTAAERSRALGKASGKAEADCASFGDRLLLLSTTHFGLATPMLNIAREKTADGLSVKVIQKELENEEAADTLTIKNITKSRFQVVQLKMSEGFSLSSPDLADYAAVPAENGTAFVFMKFKTVKKSYRLTVNPGEPSVKNTELTLKTKSLEIAFSRFCGIESVICGGKKTGGTDFLKSFISYGGKRYDFKLLGAFAVPVYGNANCIRLSGSIHLPDEISGGRFIYDFFTVPFSDGVFVKTEIHYPHTAERDAISTENSSLGRFTDNLWTECAPFELSPRISGDLSVVKRNFAGDISSYRMASFAECDEKNRELDSFNHQLSGGFVGLSGGGCGLALAVSRQTLNSMAFCPMRYRAGLAVLNPFGTYYGRQRHHYTRSKNEIQNAYGLIAAQSKSLAPSYNGASETALMGLFGFDGELPQGKTLDGIISFADGCVAVSPENCILRPFYGDNAVTAATERAENAGKTKSPVLYGIKGNLIKYIKTGSKAILHIVREQIKSGGKDQ